MRDSQDVGTAVYLTLIVSYYVACHTILTQLLRGHLMPLECMSQVHTKVPLKSFT